MKGNWIPWDCPCGVQFKRRFSRIKQGKEKYCSRECSDTYRVKYNGNDKRIYKAWNKGKVGVQKGRTGKENHFWKGGVSQKNKTERELISRTIEYKKWRKSIFERDDYTCQVCFSKGIIIHANHIKKWSDCVDLRFEIKNGITVCKDCHLKKINWHETEWEIYFITNLKKRNLL